MYLAVVLSDNGAYLPGILSMANPGIVKLSVKYSLLLDI